MQKSEFLKTRNGRWFGVAVCALLVLTLAFSLSGIRPVSAETLSSWTSTTPWKNSVESGITSQSCVTSSGYVYCVGGFLGGGLGPQSAVWYAALSSSGVGTWYSTASYPTGFSGGSCAASGGYIYCVGGDIDNDGDYTTNVYYASLSSSGVGTWTSTTAYPIIIAGESCAASNSYIYCVGGSADTSYPNIPTNAVEYASVSSSGVGAWTTSDYPADDNGATCAISSGYIYCVGGKVIPSMEEIPVPTVLVYYASISDGLGAWTSSTNYPTGITWASCVTNDGYIYCVGGDTDNSGDFTAAVYYAPVSSTGVGTWATTTSYPQEIYSESCVTYTGDVYCVGGNTEGSFIVGAVNYASTGLSTSSSGSSSGSSSSSSSSRSSSSSSSTTTTSTTTIPPLPPPPSNPCQQSGNPCYTTYALFSIALSGLPAGGAVVQLTGQGYSSQATTSSAPSTSLLCTENPTWTAEWGQYWGCFAGETGQFTLEVGATYSYTVTLTSGTVLTGSFTASVPWTVTVITVSA